jgi:hydrogenase maturation factor
MCLIQTGVVVALSDDAAIVRTDGHDRLLTSLLVPDLQVGEVVLVGLGTVFNRATADEAAELDRLVATARGSAPSIDDSK